MSFRKLVLFWLIGNPDTWLSWRDVDNSGWTISSGKPFMGICLGLQILFERSEESPNVEGLSILKELNGFFLYP